MQLAFHNMSKSNIVVKKVERRAWILPQPSMPDTAQFIDFGELSRGALVDSEIYVRGPFVQDFAPDADASYDLVWLVKRREGLAIFRVDLFAEVADTEPLDFAYIWDNVCGIAPSPIPGVRTERKPGRSNAGK